MIQDITATELRQMLEDDQQSLLLLDVREEDEYALCSIDGSVNIPMSQISSRVGELQNNTDIVTICHHGMRSLQVAQFLVQTELFNGIYNLRGGIDAWAESIDESMQRY